MDFLELANQNGWRDNYKMKIPYIDLPHLKLNEEPAYEDYLEDRMTISSIPDDDIISNVSLPDSLMVAKSSTTSKDWT